VLIDDFTHFTWTFPIRQKSDVFHILRSFLAYTKTQFGLPLLALQTDNGREFGSNALRLLLSAHGVAFRLSCPHTSQQNGKAERILRTLNDCVRTLLIHSAAPLEFWAEALATATHLINRRPCRAMGTTTPFELLFGVPPDYGDLCVFRCLCYPTSRRQLHTHSRHAACVFMGYPSDHRGYRCFDIDSRRVYTSRHLVFDEHTFPFQRTAPAAAASPAPDHDDDMVVQGVPRPPPAARAPRHTSSTPTLQAVHGAASTPATTSGSATAPTSSPRSSTPTPNTVATPPPVTTPVHSPAHASPAPPIPSLPAATPSTSRPIQPTSPPQPVQTRHHMVARARAGIF
jgi:histone deacetylase 1/2